MSSAKKSLADFKAAHDKSFIVPAKIKAGLEKLGADGWEYEIEFAKLAGVANHEISRFREQFADFIVLVKSSKSSGYEKKVWAGSKALAAKMREMV